MDEGEEGGPSATRGGGGPAGQAIDDALAVFLPGIWESVRRRRARAERPFGPNGRRDGRGDDDNVGERRAGPYVLGLSGLQGSGKTTWAEALARKLKSSKGPAAFASGTAGTGAGAQEGEEEPLNVVVLSIDDLYRDHDGLVAVRDADPSNALLRTRGQPGTHDEALAADFFASLAGDGGGEDGATGEVAVPSFDKGAHGGEGDRAPRQQWVRAKLPVDVLVFEGWCVGFQAIGDAELEARWRDAVASTQADDTAGPVGRNEADDDEFATRTLALHALAHLRTVNANLRRYNAGFMSARAFDALVHLDTRDLGNVYRWRIEQEHALIARRGAGGGMSDSKVVEFVKGYMPAYELYLDGLRKEAFPRPRRSDGEGRRCRQLRVLLDGDRNVISMTEM